MNCSNCTNAPVSSFDHGTTQVIYSAPAIYSFLSIGIIGILTNLLLTLVIATDKEMKSPCFKLILASGFGSLVLAVSSVLAALDRIGLWSDNFRSRFFCQFMSGFFLKVGAILFNSQVSFLIAADRLLGAVSPVLYRRRGKWYTATGIGVSVSIGVIEVLYLAFGQSPNEVLPACANTAAVQGLVFRQVFSVSNFFFCALCVVSYSAMMVFFQLRKAQLHGDNGWFASDAEKELFVKQFETIMPAAKLLCALYVLLGVTPEIMFGVINALSLFGGVLHSTAEEIKATSALVEIIALTARSQQFRQGVRRIFAGNWQNSTSVTSLQQR